MIELKYGAIISPRDSRDYKWEKIGMASLPFNWSEGYRLDVPLKTKNQDLSLSCGGQAMSYYGETLNANFDGTQEERSAKFIYAPLRCPGGGTTGRDLMDFVVKNGWGYEALTPSMEAQNRCSEAFMSRTEDITKEAKEKARGDRAMSYARIQDTTNIDTIAQMIRDNSGALIGLDGSNNGTWRSMFPQAPNKLEWRHWVFATGARLINGMKFIVIKNSWGNDIGESGEQYIGEEYFKFGHCFEAWTCIYNTEKDKGFKHRFDINLQRGMAGDEVVALQKALRLEGLFTYPTDTGNFGSVTQKAVYDFQILYNIAPLTRWLWRGFYCGPSTRKVLNEKYGKI